MKCAKSVLLGALLLPGLAMAQSGTRATFEVTKIFADGNDEDSVTVSIDCNTGIILDQDKVLGDGDSVEFVVVDFTAGSLNCTIDELDATDGYSADYSGNGDEEDCTWTAVADGDENDCEITNSPDAVEIEVTKTWNIVGDNNNVNLNYTLRVYCDEVFYDEVSCTASTDCQAASKDVWIGSDDGEGPGSETFTFDVRPAFPDSSCYVYEQTFDSAIDTDNGCGSLTVSAGEGASCEIINTVFFEGIPTLSQYGMAIMALLMLGVGFVGFRRFV